MQLNLQELVEPAELAARTSQPAGATWYHLVFWMSGFGGFVYGFLIVLPII